jgi:hypothetical protein
MAEQASSFTPLRFLSFPASQLETCVCIDAAYACNPDHSSQLGVLAMLRDRQSHRCSVVHYFSVKSKRVCRSILAAELLALVEGFDVGFAIQDSLRRISGFAPPLVLYTDSQSLYHLAISLTRTTERRLMVDLALLREAYERRDITHFAWIPGHENPADGFTKVAHNKALSRLLATCKFAPTLLATVERDYAPVRTERRETVAG